MRPCCEDSSNRVDGPGPRGRDGIPERDDVVVTHCSVCEARHVEVEVDPIKLGIKFL